MGKIIGIDLGTTNSAMAVLEGGEPTIIANSDGGRTTPSVVSWKGDDRIVGNAALHQAVSNYKNTVYSVKRFIGRAFSELDEQDLMGLTYDVHSGEKGRPSISTEAKDLLPEEVSAAVLSRLKADAEAFLGEPVEEAVITVPAYFDDNQRQATKDAAAIAGLKCERIINEPTAAALAYGFGKEGIEKKVLVFDLGGGTFDVSILDITGDIIEVVSTAGDNHLGGDIWDGCLCEYLEGRFADDHGGFDLSGDLMTRTRVLEAARKAKEDLSTAPSVSINLPFIAADASGPLHMDYELTREDFEGITAELLERCRTPIRRALEDAGIQKSDLDDVLLVGGSTRIPSVQKVAEEETGRKPSLTVNPDEVVALGACIQGGVLSGECTGILLLDVNSMSLGIKLANGKTAVMIPRNTAIPASATDVFTTQADNQSSVEIVLIQGESELAAENKELAKTSLKGIPPMRCGEPQIEIELSYNADGIIVVSAKELSTGTHIDVQIEASTKLSDNEVRALAAAEATA